MLLNYCYFWLPWFVFEDWKFFTSRFVFRNQLTCQGLNFSESGNPLIPQKKSGNLVVAAGDLPTITENL